MKTTSRWLTANQAVRILRVRPQTLYAYVTRGRIGARPHPDDPRRSLYRASDVMRLAGLQQAGRTAEAVAANALAWGEPVLPTAISTIAGGRPWYRGRDAIALVKEATLEEVAGLLWNVERCAFTQPPKAHNDVFTTLAARITCDVPADVVATAAGAFLSGSSIDWSLPIHRWFAAAWQCDELGADLLRRTLVLLADHELNASTFAARVAASTGATLGACALAGLAALSGPLHGGAAACVQELVAEADRTGAMRAVEHSLKAHGAVPGFGHILYPDGDPRAHSLLEAFAPSHDLTVLIEAVETAIEEPPNVDFALVALAQTLRLPPEAPFALFVTARCVGWIAHALEQRATGHLVRPRARYVGPPAPELR